MFCPSQPGGGSHPSVSFADAYALLRRLGWRLSHQGGGEFHHRWPAEINIVGVQKAVLGGVVKSRRRHQVAARLD